MQQDPDGHYARLGLRPGASAAAITAAYRAGARRLHPDVPGTGTVAGFVALKAAYDVLHDPIRRAAYDATGADSRVAWPESGPQPAHDPPPPPPRASGLDRHFALWAGFLVASAVLATWVMVLLATGPTAGLHGMARTPGPAPEPRRLPWARLAGRADHFVLPGLGPARVFAASPQGARPQEGPLRAIAALPDFATVHVLGYGPGRRLAAIRLAGGRIGFVAALRLAPGGRVAARAAFCADRAGPTPPNGAVLARAGHGPGWFVAINHDLEPAVVKLRDGAGRVVGSLYLRPGGRGVLRDLPAGPWVVDLAVGELWSRACRRFAAGERAQRFRFRLGSGSILAIPPDLPAPAMPADIPDRAFAAP